MTKSGPKRETKRSRGQLWASEFRKHIWVLNVGFGNNNSLSLSLSLPLRPEHFVTPRQQRRVPTDIPSIGCLLPVEGMFVFLISLTFFLFQQKQRGQHEPPALLYNFSC